MLFSADALWVLALALALDALIGDPDAIWRRWPHPVAWFGALIGGLDRRLNREVDGNTMRRSLGVASLALVLAVCIGASVVLHVAIKAMPWGWIVEAALASVLIAQRSLYDHVARVAEGLEREGLDGGRRAVAMIVGRDPLSLDEAGVARAAIESAAENFADGVVAPAFWFALFGLPGLVAYKAVNTADSMIGHKSARHAAYGWAAARLDDVMNLAPARLAGLLLSSAAPLAGGSSGAALRAMLRDARMHRSPNAGWPEAAMAGGLGVALAGPRVYAAGAVEDPFLNAGGRRDAGSADIRRALRVMLGGCGGMFVLAAVSAYAM